ncbi:MAG: ATP cone domain-containing protein, partial [Victivallis vadensis]
MKIVKRSGAEEEFSVAKILAAVTKANQTVEFKNALTAQQIEAIGEYVSGICKALDRALSVEEIQDIVETRIMQEGAFEVAKKYITYRYVRNLIRQANTTDNQILSLIECNNEEVKQENSNKNPTITSVQRDYMAGEVSKD